jgi:hypothetical protein
LWSDVVLQAMRQGHPEVVYKKAAVTDNGKTAAAAVAAVEVSPAEAADAAAAQQ